jgi:hypothetical protein
MQQFVSFQQDFFVIGKSREEAILPLRVSMLYEQAASFAC